MSACCVRGCRNRHSSTSKLQFYRIPSGYRPFQANRRRLWLGAIQQVNGGAEELSSNARVCGAHFVSGQASMDHDSPDFVPSVFTRTKPNPSPKKKVRRSYRRRRRRHHRAAGKPAPPEDDSSVDLQSSVLMETESELSEAVEMTSDPSVLKGAEPLTQETEATSSPMKPPLFFKAPTDTLKLDKMSPVVLLKPVVASAGGFHCELCSQNFITVLQLVKHKRMHEEDKKTFVCEICGKHFTGQADFAKHQHTHTDESSFPCNICDRSFTTNHNLKRHKLLHVKDGRKCRLCGVLFCRRHNHILFLPQPDTVSESDQDSSIVEPQNVDSNLLSENSLVKFSLKPKTNTTPPPAAHTSTLLEIPLSMLPFPPPPVRQYSRTSSTSSQFKAPLSSQPTAFIQSPPSKHLELPASLQIFSPQYLTSALLEVKRNYEYILSKTENVKREIVKEEQIELPQISPDKQSVEQVRRERTAYDLEVVL